MTDSPPPSPQPALAPPGHSALSDSAGWGPPTTPIGVPAEYAPPTFLYEPTFAPPRGAHPTLPLAAGLGALLVLTVSLLASKYVLDLLVGFRWPVVIYIALLALIGYGPSLGWARYALRRWGSGHASQDVGVTPRWSDLGWAPLIWFATVAIQVAIAAAVLILDIPLSNNTDGVGELSADRTYAVAIVITAVIAAPIVEELVFRGLVMRSLLSKLHPVLAVGAQGLLFGVAHVDPVRGIGNIGLAMVLTGVGISFGSAAYLLRRITPTICAHAILNGLVMVLLLTGIRDRILEQNPDLFDSDASVTEQIAIVDQPHVAEPHGRRDPHVPD